ncbi:hypothetical protein [Desertivirga arenae]|uniref:hypothetical protein n=1 Tax=Desertivirga arenae TaxID=2810309 RepID=UPI001A971780|nr:hypothetical protein [Pedobacter sp. SYSU D00823]
MSKKQEKAEVRRPEPTITAQKHWIVYSAPAGLIAAGLILFLQDDTTFKIFGGVIAAAGLIWAISKANEKWHLTDQHLVMEKGVFSKKKHEISVHDIYQASAEHHKLSKYFRMGNVRTRRRADECSGFNHSFITNHEEFSKAIEHRVKKHATAHSLNQVYELKEKGAISSKEYDLIKLGHVTQQFLSKL